MTPHRPWPLFVLSLALWTGASSAQTWTTVWTPGSAPAPTHTKMEQEMEPEKDHKSPTNCYPCKEWEAYGDGTGKWVLYPRGTTPNRCAGDTTDYTCKECDGKGEVRNKEDYTPCGTCGCCEGGNCVEYTNNCPHPIPDPLVILNKVGPCPLCDIPGIFGCVSPDVFSPMPDVTICLQNCTWKIVVNSIAINYFEGLCPDNCEFTIDSIDDIHVGNYCDIIAAIHDRINRGPPSLHPLPPDEGDKPPFCFAECLSTHENVHVEQLRQEWDILWPQVVDEIRNNSVEFDCQSVRQESQARAQFLVSVASTMVNFYRLFIDRWNIPGRGEIPAEIAEKDCLNNFLALIEQKASDNGWPWPCP